MWKPEKCPFTLHEVIKQETTAHSFLLVVMFSGMIPAPAQF